MALPNSLDKTELAAWLRQNAVETVIQEEKVFYSDDEIEDFKQEIVEAQKEIRKLHKLKSEMNDCIMKGYKSEDEELFKTFHIPETDGIKPLQSKVEIYTDKLNKGYEINAIDLYAVPDDQTEQMVYYDIHGSECKERTRPLSAREINKYLGMFAKSNQQAM